jgi:hypothetical protein
LKVTLLRRIFRWKRHQTTGGWGKLHNEELHNLYSQTNIFTLIKSRRMGRACNMNGGKGEFVVFLLGKSEGKTPQGASRCRWEDNIVTDLREIG